VIIFLKVRMADFKKFTYVAPAPPAEFIESTSFTLDFTDRKFIHIGIDPTNNFNVMIHIITQSRHIPVSLEFFNYGKYSFVST